MTATAKIKTLLIKLLGSKVTGIIHGIRFAFLVFVNNKIDPETRLLKKLINKGDVCVDVGANSADWTNFFSRIVGKTGIVFAFEADPYYAYATRIACRFLVLKNVKLFDFGLSEKSEVVRLIVSDESGFLFSGTQKISKSDIATVNDGNSVIIRLQSLDSLSEKYPLLFNTKIIKIDVEGYELFVLRGAEKIIKQAKPVLVIECGEYQDHGYTTADLNSYLIELGYTGYAVTQNNQLEAVDHEMNATGCVSSNRIYFQTYSNDIEIFS